MMGSLLLGSGCVATEGKHRLLKLRDIVALTGTHPNTIRRATDSGRLHCFRLPSGARRFRLQDVEAWLGQAPPDHVAADVEKPARVPIAAMVRVSSTGQSARIGSSDKGSLQFQEERVRTYINQRFGKAAEVTWYKSIGSGLDFNRPGLLRCLEDVLAGKYAGGFIVAQDFTRICRFGIRLVEHLCKLGNCQIVYAMNEGEDEGAESLTDEILSILTHYTARASGAKAKAMLQTRVPPSTLSRIFELHRLGHSHRQITPILATEGIGKGDCGKPITKNVVTRLLRENKAMLAKVLPDNFPASKSSITRFVGAKLRRAEATNLSFKALQTAYVSWCKQENETPILSQAKLSKAVVSHFPNVEQSSNRQGQRVYLNLSLLRL